MKLFECLVTVLNVIMLLFTLFFLRGEYKLKDKATVVGFSFMALFDVANTMLIWWR